MTEEEWQTATDMTPMLRFLEGKENDRKLRLFACGCCRTVWHLIAEGIHQDAILTAEKHVDGQVTNFQLGQAISAVHRIRRKRHRLDWAVYNTVRYPGGVHYGFADSVAYEIACHIALESAPNPSPTAMSSVQGGQFVMIDVPPNADRIKFNETKAAQYQRFSAYLRDIFGNPFHPITVDPTWVTPTVVQLAEHIYQERTFDQMPILADALQDAGCDNEDVLSHCRESSEHVRGCWVVDLLLDKK